MCGQYQIQIGDETDRFEILKLVWQAAGEIWAHGKLDGGGHQKCVAIGYRFRHVFGTEIAARAGPILDVDGTVQIGGELLCQFARDNITAAPRRIRDDELDGPRWPFFGNGTTRSRDKSVHNDQEGANGTSHPCHVRTLPDVTVKAHTPLPLHA